MRAFVVNKYGDSNVQAKDVSEPKVGPNDVLVSIKAASINPLDLMLLNGEFKQLLKYKVPFVLGHDLSGVVIEVGSKVSKFKVGDEIYARLRDLQIGTFAERIAVNEADVALKPQSLSFAEAAATPLVALAAYQALTDVAKIRSGQKVLIHGGAGAFGSAAIQLAKHLGAYVATTVRTQDMELAKGLGADEVIDFTNQDFVEILKDFDLVIDSLGKKSVENSLMVVKPGGLVIGLAGPPDSGFASQLGQAALKPVMGLMSLRTRRLAKKRNAKYKFFFMTANGQQLEKLAELYDAKVIQTLVAKTFPFSETPEALDYVKSGKSKGKVVIVH